MNFNTEPIKNWFGFTRRERRSTFTLLVIILIITVIRYAIPDSRVTLEDIKDELADNITVNIDSGSRTTAIINKKTYLKSTYGTGNQRFKALKSNYTLQRVIQSKEKSVVDVNLADTSALIRLPGIGSVLSLRIIKYRNYLGGYARIGQLKEVYGLTEETFEMIKTRITADSTYIKRININTADYKELTKVRYLEKYEIISILKYRQLAGRISSMKLLTENKIISFDKASKVGPYLKFSD